MNTTQSTTGIKSLLFLFFSIGILVNLFIIIDGGFTNQVLRPRGTGGSTEDQPLVDQLRKSIVLIITEDCAQRNNRYNGTGFVINESGQSRYIATNAHVVNPGATCDGVTVCDYRGKTHQAFVEGVSVSGDLSGDLAILKIDMIEDNELPPLELLDSKTYETGHDGEKIVTIGYPVLGTASTVEKASISSEGQIYQFDQNKKCFITSGLSLNPGNSGGPIFLADSQSVLGLAVAKTDVQVAENIGIVIPINQLKDFFKAKTGIEI
jgi:S1-C subfamily serine protease